MAEYVTYRDTLVRLKLSKTDRNLFITGAFIIGLTTSAITGCNLAQSFTGGTMFGFLFYLIWS